MPPTYQLDDTPTRAELIELYDAVGWTAYTREPDRLAAAVAGSAAVATARDSGRLVGLARVVGDGHTIAYLQDILVAPSHRRRGIAGELFRRVLAPFAHVRQQVLITDDEPGQRAFYEAMGFRAAHELEHPVRAFVRFS
ncbi:GNAT family N-acetyltransferase [Georgenia sp. Z1491]|uniref:GNAT family N-acetyltransferase n=1 Tax=Georgenia sp. Z1491 TaxID=3416707 RepID=UPI003CFB7A77